MARPAKAIINLNAIQANYQLAKQLAPQAQALAIIKANAYGHGAVPVAKALSAKADGFGVACIEEAIELREAGIERPILLLEGIFSASELALVEHYDFYLSVHNPLQLQWITQAQLSKPLTVFLKVDTGMHRLGFAPDEFKAVYIALKQCSHIKQIIPMTHFARADELACPATSQQLHGFKALLKDPHFPSASLANSAAILAWPETHYDWIRPGIMLYGASPLEQENQASQQLQAAMTLSSELIAVRSLNKGESIGYGARFHCEQPTEVGVVAMGYADGYPRHAKDGTPVALNGRRTRLIGRVSMDMLTIDVSGMNAKIGDQVELWGNTIPVNEVASYSDTIAYQLFTGVRRVSFVYQS